MILFENGTIHTVDPHTPRAEVVLVSADGRIAYVGRRAAARIPAGVRRVDLAGATLIPGFNDAHVHLWKLGSLLTVQVDARRAAAPDIEAILHAYADRAARLPADTWLTGRGYNEAELPERRHPTRADLDRASTSHPITLTRTCGHMIVANSRALTLAGIDRETPDPPGGVIVRDAAGEPTGLLQETAMGLLARAMPHLDDAALAAAIRAAIAHQAALGITSATDPLLTPDHVRVYRALDAAGDLAIRVQGLPIRRPDGGRQTYPLPEKHLSPRLRIDGVKFFADGGLSGATAAIHGTYRVTGDSGVLRFDDDELHALMHEAVAGGFRLATHAIGDRALDQVIGVYERIARDLPSVRLRHRIEHFGLPTADHLRRAAALRLIAVPQTVFLPELGSAFRRYLPDDYLARCYPVRALWDAGITVALSSDAPVVADDNPLTGIKAAIDRRDGAGVPIAADQAIRADQALWAYTMGGAIASGDAANRGSLSVGKHADLTILSGDPLMTPPDALPSLRVIATYVGGQRVHSG